MDYSLNELLDMDQVRSLAENFFKATGIPIGIMGADGTVFMEIGWHDVCTNFHLPHPEARQCHIEMLRQIASYKDPACFIYSCGNGMHHAVTPLLLVGKHIASVYLGQFFYDKDVIDLEPYRARARQFGFDEQVYLAALKTVPIYTDEKVQDVMAFFRDMVAVLANTSLARFKERLSNKERAESEEKYRTLVETTHTGYVIIDGEGYVIDANQEYVRLSGHSSPDEILGRNVVEWTAKHDQARNRAEVNKILETGFVYNLEIDYVDRIGRVTPIDVNATVLQSGADIRILALCRDISARRQIERSLQLSEARLLEAQIVSHTGSWDLDLAAKTMWGSVEAHRIYDLDITPGLLIPLSLVQDLVEPPYRPILDQALEDLVAYGEQKPYNVEFFIRRYKDGKRRAVHSIARLVRDEQGSAVRVMGTIQDITERKLVEEEILRLNSELEKRVRERTVQLEAANKELEAFAYSVSHDLRAPLRALNGYSHMLIEDYTQVLDATGLSYLQHISAATTNMSRLIDDILKLSRVSRSEMLLEPVDLSSVAGLILTRLQAEQPDRRVIQDITPGLMVNADPSLMQIAMTNLLSNAWKFTSKKEETHITVGVEDRDGRPVYFIRDNGAGFDMAYQHKLFLAFQRLHSDKDFEGTGIGLAIVQRIIQRHGGNIWAVGAPNRGATFKFTLFDPQ